MPKVSIIVIIYKVEKYVRQCLESLLAQTYRDLEIICVVGKGDAPCETICAEFAEKDERVRVIAEEPKGTASARNTGLKAAGGEYIAFVDGDDYIAPDMIETMVKASMDDQADIAVIGKYYAYENITESDTAGGNISILDTRSALKIVLYQTGFFLHIWDKLYRRKLFDTIRFDEGKKVEDRIISYRLLTKANKIVYNKSPKYYFRVSEDSGSKVEDNLAKSFEADREICADIRKNHPPLQKACDYFLAYEAMSVIQNSMLYGTFSKEHDKEYLDCVRELAGSVYANSEVGRGVKVKTYLCVHAPQLLKRLTLERRKKFLEGHKPYTSGTDWNNIFERQGIR